MGFINTNKKKVIFIGGSSYSGSTMLDMMLANSPEGFSVGEVYALFRPFRPHHFEPECGCGNPDCKLWLQVRETGENQLYETIFKLLPDISFIVDSSKDPWWIQKQAENLRRKNIEVYHLLIWKEPASFAHSMMKRKRKGWEKAWKNYYRLYLTLIDNYLSVPYSDLAQNPDQILRDICRRCGLKYHQGKEEFWQKKHHTLFGNDSAKIHLQGYKNATSIQNNHALIGLESEHEHRTVYYDTHYLELIPQAIILAIEADSDFKNILLILNGARTSELIETIYFSSTQFAAAKMRWLIKAMIGRIFGRYKYIL